jgi:CHAT domain-containing protein
MPAVELPHITWCTTGPLSSLPLHAAGNYKDPHSRVYNYAISSYTATLSALLAKAPNPSEFRGVLAVGQTPRNDQENLLGTVAELALIESLASDLPVTQLEGDQATTTAVLEGMGTHSWVHLACPVIQNDLDPTRSAFQLHDGMLDLTTILSKPHRNGGLAYISRCQEAGGDESFLGEPFPLATGLIMAGYSTVFATMWAVQDEDAPLVAGNVYSVLMRDGVADCGRAANALHYAVEALRSEVGEKAFTRWAPYIHFGL